MSRTVRTCGPPGANVLKTWRKDRVTGESLPDGGGRGTRFAQKNGIPDAWRPSGVGRPERRSPRRPIEMDDSRTTIVVQRYLDELKGHVAADSAAPVVRDLLESSAQPAARRRSS
jgi:hypothetical protein